MVKQILAIGAVFIMATVGWMTLGGTIVARTEMQDRKLREQVGQLWGTPLTQSAPSGSLSVPRAVETEKWDSTKGRFVERSTVYDTYSVPLVKSAVRVGLDLDQRKKGLLWYSTYRVHFTGTYVLANRSGKDGQLCVSFAFPAASGLYDGFVFEVDGQRVAITRGDSGIVTTRLPCSAGASHTLLISYVSQGLDRFVYRFGNGITEVRDFELVASTDFDGFDFPANTVSPTSKDRRGPGWALTWKYADLISGNGIGVEMPKRIDPGPMAARISFFAPVSLGFFFFLVFVIAVLKGVHVHPLNYFFLACSFFAFHLLLAYLVDHISIHAAFVVCSVVSLFLVISYMRLVAGSRFAFVETALAQLVYLVGFSYAFFFEGFTGLTVTIGAIVTLYVVMQLTAKINWREVV